MPGCFRVNTPEAIGGGGVLGPRASLLYDPACISMTLVLNSALNSSGVLPWAAVLSVRNWCGGPGLGGGVGLGVDVNTGVGDAGAFILRSMESLLGSLMPLERKSNASRAEVGSPISHSFRDSRPCKTAVRSPEAL